MNPTRDLARCATFTVIALFAGHLRAFAGQQLDPKIAAATGCDTAAFSRAQAEFERLQTLRQFSPDAVSADALRAASSDYVSQAETCYQALYASSPKIDDGGMRMGEGVGTLGAVAQPFVTKGTKWGAGSPYTKGQDVPGPGIPGGTVTYSFMADGVSMSGESPDANVAITSLPGFQACFVTRITNAFAAWSAVANIQFAQVVDNGVALDGAGAAGDIRIGSHTFDGPSNVLAHAYYPPPNGNTAAGDIHFDRQEPWSCTPGANKLDIGIVALHEIGHSLGLDHEPTKLAVMNPFYNSAVSTPQPDDISGISSIYGSNGSMPPTATTGAASAIGVSSATLNGSVNPNGTTASGFFQYGTTTSYGSALGPFSLGSGSTAVPLAVTASGLTCGTLYHFRIVGSSSAGTTNGSDASFSTSACPQLTLSKTGTGTGTVTTNPAGINCGSTCTASFPVGQVVTLTATPVASSLLTAWSGDPDCSDGVVTMSAARNCTATFTLIPANSKILTISKIGSGTVTSSPAGIGCDGICSAFFTTGQLVTLSATASPGSTFGGWSGDADCSAGAVTMSADSSCTATFKLLPAGDVNGDGKGDLLWRQTQTGDVALFLMNGVAITQAPVVAAGVPLAWQIANVGDLDGDGKADVIWRNSQTGDVAAFLMDGAVIKQAPIVASGLPLAWQIANVADLDGDGKADVIFRNTQTGTVAAWLMNGTAITQAPIVSAGVPLAWQIVGAGDLDGDGKADLVWRHSQTGDVAVWLMDGATIKQGPVIAAGVPLGWQIAGVGDLDGDGKADLVWRQTQVGDVAVWLMNGTSVKQGPVVAAGVPLAWQISTLRDVDGDGLADLVWRNTTTGDVAVWLMNGVAIKQAPIIASGVPLGWQIQR